MFFSAQLSAQVCYDELSATTPDTRFTINSDGTVLDTQTGLMWARCSFGQIWDNELSRCTGGAQQIEWQQALSLANTTRFAGFDDWHIPNVKELTSIVERKCVDPAINSSVFDDTQAENYWTNTSGIELPDHAWAVAFYSGKNNLKSKTADLYLRLVRYYQ